MNSVQHCKTIYDKNKIIEFNIMWLWESQCYYNINRSYQMFCIAKIKIIKVHVKKYYLQIISWFCFFEIFYLEIFHDFISFEIVVKTLLKIVQESGFNLFQPKFKKNLICTSFHFLSWSVEISQKNKTLVPTSYHTLVLCMWR
jgi:hypothetical protein